VIARHVSVNERGDVVAEIAKHSLRTREVDELFRSLGWDHLAEMGGEYRATRLLLIAWACGELSRLGQGTVSDRLSQLAESLPLSFDEGPTNSRSVSVQ